jgi:hypothetical protein
MNESKARGKCELILQGANGMGILDMLKTLL